MFSVTCAEEKHQKVHIAVMQAAEDQTLILVVCIMHAPSQTHPEGDLVACTYSCTFCMMMAWPCQNYKREG